MKIKETKLAPLLFFLIFAITLMPPVAATVVWSDDFNDGNYDDWTIEESAWVIVDGALDHDSSFYNTGEIWHDSTQVVGTWSFDILHEGYIAWDRYIRILVNFMINESSGYGIRISETGVYFQRIDDGTPTPLQFTIVENLEGTWTSYHITRDVSGTFNVYLNTTSDVAEPNLTVTDTTYSLSDRFVIREESNFLSNQGFSIDNIIVDDEITVTPSEATPTETTTPTETETPTDPGNGEPFPLDPTVLAIGGGAVIVLLIVVVVAKRR